MEQFIETKKINVTPYCALILRLCAAELATRLGVLLPLPVVATIIIFTLADDQLTKIVHMGLPSGTIGKQRPSVPLMLSIAATERLDRVRGKVAASVALTRVASWYYTMLRENTKITLKLCLEE